MVKYRYMGYTHLSIPDGWVPIVKQMLRDIDKKIRPWYIPRFVLNWIYLLAHGNSVVRVRSWFFYRIIQKIPVFSKCFISDIKDKYAELRVYGSFSPEIEKIVDAAVEKSNFTCERCGSTYKVEVKDYGWLYTLCQSCRIDEDSKRVRQFNEVYSEYIPEGYYGLSFYDIGVIRLLVEKFSQYIIEYDNFKFYQLKLKFGVPRLYIDGPSTEEIFDLEDKIAKILKNEEKFMEESSYPKSLNLEN